MFITIKQSGRKIKVDVSSKDCPSYTCFSPHKFQHRSYNNAEGSMTNSDNYYSCSYRNYYGCPDNKTKKNRTLENS